jgi:hypothetical protein
MDSASARKLVAMILWLILSQLTSVSYGYKAQNLFAKKSILTVDKC